MWLIDFIKNLVCKKELEELNRWRNHWCEHRQWFDNNPSISMVLDNLKDNAVGNGHKWIGEVFHEVSESLGTKTIVAFAIVKNAKGDLWKGHYKTDPKLGVTQEMLDACQFVGSYRYISIEKAIQHLDTANSMYPERNYEICPIYSEVF